jgi:hypothetical protein
MHVLVSFLFLLGFCMSCKVNLYAYPRSGVSSIVLSCLRHYAWLVSITFRPLALASLGMD